MILQFTPVRNLAFSVLFLCSLLPAQDISISGTIIDIKSGLPLQDAEVTLNGRKITTTTNQQGKFIILYKTFLESGNTSNSSSLGPAEELYTLGRQTKLAPIAFRDVFLESGDSVLGTLHVSKPGYIDVSKPLESLQHDSLVIELGRRSEFEGGWARVPEILAMITPPTFPERDFNVHDYGAKGDGIANNYQALKKAIEACHLAGGGRVVVPRGTYRMEGPVHLLSNVNLHLMQGAKLDFHWNQKGYLVGDPRHRGRVLVRWEGTWIYNYSPLIYAFNQQNIAITGPGEVNGNGLDVDWPDHVDKERKLVWAHTGLPIDERITDELTPGTIEFYFCRNVLLEGFTSREPNERNVHPVMCSNVTIRGLNILPTSFDHKEDDGIDPDSCRYVLIEDCKIHSYDDNIGIKSGRDNDGWLINKEDPQGKWSQLIPGRPTEYILIRNNWFHGGYHNMVGIGSDQSAGAQYIYAWDCEAGQVELQRNILEIKANPNRGGEVRHIYIRDINARHCDTIMKANHRYMSFYAEDGPQRLPHTHHIYMENITVENGGKTGFIFRGWEPQPMHDFYFRNITLPDGESAEYDGVQRSSISATNVSIAGKIWQPLAD